MHCSSLFNFKHPVKFNMLIWKYPRETFNTHQGIVLNILSGTNHRWHIHLTF